jgi:hypothetical protein
MVNVKPSTTCMANIMESRSKGILHAQLLGALVDDRAEVVNRRVTNNLCIPRLRIDFDLAGVPAAKDYCDLARQGCPTAPAASRS